jgi:hypothetical protein
LTQARSLSGPFFPEFVKSLFLSFVGEMAAANGSGAALFSEEELREVSGVRLGEGFVEVMCGCTSRRYGDAVGRLLIYPSGDLAINCDCTPGCGEGSCPIHPRCLFLFLFFFFLISCPCIDARTVFGILVTA